MTDGDTALNPLPASFVKPLQEFRTVLTAALLNILALDRKRAERTAAQDALQLVWSFVVCGLSEGDAIDSIGLSLLRGAFPDELFGNDPNGRFDDLRDSVPIRYADQWKYLPSDHLCSLVRGCVSAAQPEAVAVYRDRAVTLAIATVAARGPLTARAVFDLAKFDSMLKHAQILTEVATAEAEIPSVEQIKGFYLGAGPESSLSFAFLARVNPGESPAMVRVFADQHGSETAADLLLRATSEADSESVRIKLRALLGSLKGSDS